MERKGVASSRVLKEKVELVGGSSTTPKGHNNNNGQGSSTRTTPGGGGGGGRGRNPIKCGLSARQGTPSSSSAAAPAASTATKPSSVRGVTPILGKKVTPLSTTTGVVRPPLKLAVTPNKPFSVKATASPAVVDRLNVSRLHEQVKLKNDFASCKDELADQTENIKKLREQIVNKDDDLKCLKIENLKLKDRFGKIQEEIVLLNGRLEDNEKELRSRQVAESLIQEKRMSCDTELNVKVAQLESEIALKSGIIKTKTELILQQEQTLKDVKQELESVTLRHNNARLDSSVNLSNNSKICRSSLSNMQASVSKRLDQTESIFKEKETQLHQAVQQAQAEIVELKAVINRKDESLDQLSERLKESKLAGEQKERKLQRAEMEIQEVGKNYATELGTLREKVTALENDQQFEAECSLQVTVLEGQLTQALKMNEELAEKLQICKEDEAEWKEAIEQKDAECSEWQSKHEVIRQNLVEAENKFTELQQAKENALLEQNGNDANNSHQSNVEVASIQAKLTEAQNLLTEQIEKSSTFEKRIAQLTKELGLCKVDVRVGTRSFKEITEQNKLLKSDRAECIKEIDLFKAEKEQLALKVQELQDEVTQVQKDKDSQMLAISELREELEGLKLTNTGLLIELQENRKTESTVLQEAKAELHTTQVKLYETFRKLEAKTVCLSMLQKSCKVLDDQLQEFEVSYVARTNEIKSLEETKGSLQLEVHSLQKERTNLKSALTEASSRLEMAECNLKILNEARCVAEKRSCEEIKSLQDKVKALEASKAELATEILSLLKELDNTKASLDSMQIVVAALERDNESCSEEAVMLSRKNADLSKEVQVLTIDLVEANEKVTDLDNRYEVLCSHQESVDHEIVERNVQLKSTIRQQAKLIEYLQQQNELLLKKKDKKFQIFGKGNNRGDENTTPRPKTADFPSRNPAMPKCSSPATPTITPVNLIREHFDVQRLEKTMDALKDKLRLLQEEAQKGTSSPVRSTSITIPPSKKEECLHLKKKDT